MKVCYIISTCDKYLDTRVKYQMETMLKNVNKEDIFYLTSKPNIEKRHFGWYAMDDEKNITWKYIHFIYNMDTILNYDWYIFIDDDTFVFKNRLETLLQQYSSSDLYYIGNELDHIKNDFCLYMSGGAGYAISNELYSKIFSHVKNTGINGLYKHWCDDLCIGLWIQDISKEHSVKQINNNGFHVGLQNNDSELQTAITFHKVMTEQQYIFYLSIVENVTLSKTVIKENNDTVFALVTDRQYFDKARRTIIDLRSKGNWTKDIVLITIDFNLNANFKNFYNIIEQKFPVIDKTNLLSKIGKNGFTDTTDKREIHKLLQWEKLHIFDDYFRKWQ